MKIFLLSFFLFASTVWGHEYLESNTHQDVYNKATELRSKYSPKDVLIVFDIDNTLLKAKQPLGSDQWFEWQSESLKNSSSEAIFKNFDDLLKAQAVFFQISSMSLTEQFLPQMVEALKKQGHNIVLLTSRGPDLRNVTERELEKNGLGFADSSIMTGIPYSFIEAPFKNKVSFMNGIFMTAGHHKGEALSYLLKKSGKKFRSIIFADDHERHTKRVFETFSNSDLEEVVTYRYSKVDPEVSKFKSSRKDLLNMQTKKLLIFHQSLFQ